MVVVAIPKRERSPESRDRERFLRIFDHYAKEARILILMGEYTPAGITQVIQALRFFSEGVVSGDMSREPSRIRILGGMARFLFGELVVKLLPEFLIRRELVISFLRESVRFVASIIKSRK